MSRAEAASKAEQAVAEEALADLPASFVATSAATRLPVAPASAAPAVAPAEEGKCTSERQSGKRCTAQSRLPVVAGTDNDGRPFKYCVEHKCTSVGCWKARFAAARLCRLCKTVPPGGELLKTLTPLFAPGAAAAMPAQAAVAPMPGHVTVPTPTQPFMLAQLAASPHPPPHLGALPSLGALPLPMPMPMLMPMTMHMPMPMPVQQVGALPPMPASSSDKSRRYTSQFPGVCWNKSKNKWKSQIYEGGTMRHIGSFDDELAAAKAYEVAVAKGFAAAVEELRPASSRKKGSKYLGVALCKQRGPNKKPWKAQIWFNSKAYSLGNHESELTAAEAYAAAAARVRAGTFNPGDPRGLRDGFDPEETAPPGSGPDDASDVM